MRAVHGRAIDTDIRENHMVFRPDKQLSRLVSARDRLELALVPFVAPLVAEELGESVCVQHARLSPELEDDIARLYGSGWDAESFFARGVRRLRDRLRSVLCDWGSPSPFKRAVLSRVAVLELLHEILAALEHQRSREWSWRGTSPLGELDRIVNVLDAKRSAVESGLMLEVLAARGTSIAEFAGVRTADLKSSLAQVEMPLPLLWRLVAAADAAKTRMFERWNHRSLPARVLAELAFLEQRHAALSAWEDQPES